MTVARGEDGCAQIGRGNDHSGLAMVDQAGHKDVVTNLPPITAESGPAYASRSALAADRLR
jgi:hypothetical protein